jgi:hypothetical protein
MVDCQGWTDGVQNTADARNKWAVGAAADLDKLRRKYGVR